MVDRDLAAIMRHLTTLPPAEAVPVTVGVDEVTGLFDDGEIITNDISGQEVQSTETVVRVIATDLTERPAIGTPVTVRLETGREIYQVREVRKDPGNQGMLRIVLTRT